ncbi:MauE/DoxX family redox-associated membrane protein [Streptomyces sp. NPDC002156]
MQAVAAFGQLCLVTVFIWSGVQKARDLRAFRRHLTATVPRLGRFSGALAAAVPAVEWSAAGLLLLRPSEWAGYFVAAVLLGVFTLYLIGLLRSNPAASCGCAGADDTPVSGAHVVRNLLLLVICALTWWAAARSAGPGLSEYAVVVAPAAVFGVTLLHLGELASLFRTTPVT